MTDQKTGPQSTLGDPTVHDAADTVSPWTKGSGSDGTLTPGSETIREVEDEHRAADLSVSQADPEVPPIAPEQERRR